MNNNSDEIDWDNLSFSDLDSLDWSKLTPQQFDEAIQMTTSKRYHELEMKHTQYASLTGQHKNTVLAKSKFRTRWNALDVTILKTLSDTPLEDLKQIFKNGIVNASKFWDAFK